MRDRLEELVNWRSRILQRKKEQPCTCSTCGWCAARAALATGSGIQEAARQLWQELGSCDCGECLACRAVAVGAPELLQVMG